jgi:methylthioxylose transferase
MTRRLQIFLVVSLFTAAAWVVWWSVINGRAQQRDDFNVFLGAAPLVGRDAKDGWDWRFGWGLIGAGSVAAGVCIGCWNGWWRRVRQRWVLAGAAIGTASFAALLAVTDGLDGLRYGAEHESEYLATLPRTPPAGEFVRTFVARINAYSVHVRGHPPGYVLVLKSLDGVGLGGVWPVVMLSVVSSAVVAAAVLVTVRATAGEVWMRRCAPLLVVAPYAIWMVTSADAFFSAVAALGVAAVAEGVTRPRRQSVWFGLVGGLLLGSLLFLTYLGALFLMVPAVVVIVAVVRRRGGASTTFLGATVAGIAVIAVFRAAGFWWFDGVAATKRQYAAGTAQFREWGYFKFGNIGAAMLAIGPLTVAGFGTLRNRRMWLLVGGAAAALLVSHLSQYTKAEVERIWLLFYPWLVIAAAGLVGQCRRWMSASLVAAQAACAVILQAALVTKW